MPIPVPGRVAEALRRSTVQVYSGHGRHQGNGSGVVLADGRVITNAHVVRGKRLSVESWEGKSGSASVVKIDRGRDLALLAAAELKAPPASLSDSAQLKVGTPVFAVGNPLGFTGAVSSGIVHSIGPAGPMSGFDPLSGFEWIHADVRLAPGNSGGPLADFQGQIVGINTMIVAGVVGTEFVGRGLALAIPSRAVQSFLSRTTSQGSLGVTVRPVRVRSGALGMMILELIPGGAAEAASLLPGDVVVAANESRFKFFDDLQAAIDQAPGALLRLDFYRGGQESLRHVTVRLLPERLSSAA
ncbi:MAG: trypsin-like peptidase domain-containing protein [Bryobacteraceae bacterium]